MRKTLSSTIAGVCFTLLLSFVAMASPTPPGESLPLLPEATDPVLGHRAAVIEWAWSPQYAERFGLPVQEGGLENGYLWLVGVKVMRVEYFERPTYSCRIVGLIENDAPIVWPPSEHYLMHPSQMAMGGGLPGQGYFRRESEGKPFIAGHSSRLRTDVYPSGDFVPKGISAPYLVFHRNYAEKVAYFELDGACAFFGDPDGLINQLVFPTFALPLEVQASAVFKEGSLRIDIPDRVMRSIYPVIREAADWTTCLLHRAGRTRLQLDGWTRKRLGAVDCSLVTPTEPDLDK